MTTHEERLEALKKIGFDRPWRLPKSRDPNLTAASDRLSKWLHPEARLAALDFGTTLSDLFQTGLSIIIRGIKTPEAQVKRPKPIFRDPNSSSTGFFLDRALFAEAK